MAVISDTAARALRDAVATRGKHKGMLLAKCPASNTLAAAAWQAAQMHANPYKVSIGAVLFFSEEQRAIYHELTGIFETLCKGRRLAWDRDREALQALGAW